MNNYLYDKIFQNMSKTDDILTNNLYTVYNLQ